MKANKISAMTLKSTDDCYESDSSK